MNVKEINKALASGLIEEPGVLPHLTLLETQPYIFTFDFGLETLPDKPGIILIRGPRQYGKSTWLEQQIKATISDHGPGTAFYLNGDEIPSSEVLYERIRELLPLFDPRRRIYRLFVDEITAVQNWQKALKRLVDAGELRNILVVTTGSKAVDLRRGAERLPGRKGKLKRSNYYFTPVSFHEFKRICGSSLGNSVLPAYLLSGGSPVACVEITHKRIISEYVHEMTRDWISGECAASGRSRFSLSSVFNALHRFGGSALGQAKLAPFYKSPGRRILAW